jgi:hypothetical protein
MQWQDWVLAVGSFIFVIALIPSIQSPDKPALSTSVLTAAVLGIFALTYMTLSLWLAAFTTSMTCVCWTILGIQKVQQVRRSRDK